MLAKIHLSEHDLADLRYPYAVPRSGSAGDFVLAIFSISCFVIVFVFGILWATRPRNKYEAEHHGTTQPESMMKPGDGTDSEDRSPIR